MISASMVETDVYEVVVEGREAVRETTHRVTLRPEYYRKLCAGTMTYEWVIVQAFKFLLEREPNTSILKRFDLEDISRYFPEFESEMSRRLAPP